MSETVSIGNWTFEPDTGVLTREDESQRLEARTAALLELLCRRRGSLVSHADIIEAVWDGRTVSPNSVAVVISDIRRALRDDPREPRYVETLPKRGYRLIAAEGAKSSEEDAPVLSGRDRQRRAVPMLAGIGILCAALLLAGVFLMHRVPPAANGVTRISVAAIENETGNAEYAALTKAVSELLTFELMRRDTLSVVPEHEVGVVVSGTLILWDGHPAISLHAKSTGDGRILWSGMAPGPEADLPSQVRRQVLVFAETARAEAFASVDRSGG